MLSDLLKIGGICMILLGSLLGLLSFFTDSPDLHISIQPDGIERWRGIATLEGKRLLLAIFGASSFAAGVSTLVGGMILAALKESRPQR